MKVASKGRRVEGLCDHGKGLLQSAKEQAARGS